MPTRQELLDLCKARGLKGYSGKRKDELQSLLDTPVVAMPVVATLPKRLNYIGSKYQLFDWISTNILEKTGWSSLAGKRIGDLFAGTGIVSFLLRQQGATVISNDVEPYSAIITHAQTLSCYSQRLADLIAAYQNEAETAPAPGYVTRHYSPFDSCERKFFTVDNAQRIDTIRKRIEADRSTLSDDEYSFLLASLLISADAVSNVPAVYGCFLKNFKAKAQKALVLVPIHTLATPPTPESATIRSNILATASTLPESLDAVYLDPPYNERQYSKNYFPLNVIVQAPEEPLKGKTGIPTYCFLSPFCKKGVVVEDAFTTLLGALRDRGTRWVFLSYNSESLIPKDRMIEFLTTYGPVSVVSRGYKRFKSFEYNQDATVEEYLYCVQMRDGA